MPELAGILLLSAPGKAMTTIILHRLKGTTHKKLRPELAGFRTDKFCTGWVETLRIITGQPLEWQFPLYLNFVDFEQAFDTVDCSVIWSLLKHCGIPIIFVDPMTAL